MEACNRPRPRLRCRMLAFNCAAKACEWPRSRWAIAGDYDGRQEDSYDYATDAWDLMDIWMTW